MAVQAHKTMLSDGGWRVNSCEDYKYGRGEGPLYTSSIRPIVVGDDLLPHWRRSVSPARPTADRGLSSILGRRKAVPADRFSDAMVYYITLLDQRTGSNNHSTCAAAEPRWAQQYKA